MARRKNDFYPTPEAATFALLNCFPYLINRDVLVYEPCAGKGDISRVLREAGANVFESDIDPSSPRILKEDARTKQYKPGSIVITNPPFNQAIEIVRNAVDQDQTCAFFLRLSFLEPTKDRGEWLKDNPPAGLIVLPRISFTGDGRSDSVTCAWMIWLPYYGPQFIDVVTRERLAGIGRRILK